MKAVLGKNSRPDWLPIKPNHWDVKRAKFVMRERTQLSTDGSETLLSISEYYGVKPRSDRHGDDTFLSRAATLEGYKVVEPGDLAMNIMLAWKGAQGVADERGIVSPAYAVFELDRKSLHPAFAHHLFRTDVYVAEFRRRSTGIIDSRLRLYPETFLGMPVVLPPLNEQLAIATYLDAETKRIDGLIEEKKRLQDSLIELKATRITDILTEEVDATQPTGDIWLPKIPVGWELKRLKHLGQVRSGLAKGKKHESGVMTVELPYMRVANVQDGYIDLSDVTMIEVAESEVERYTLRVGDVLMNEGGDYDKLGRGAMWEGRVKQCLHQNHVFAVRLDDVKWAPWVAAVTRTSYAKFYFMNNSKQSTNLASINQTNVKEFPVVIPPVSQRDELLRILTDELRRIDDLVRHVEQELEVLAEFRSSTITDAVLGRIDVRPA